MDQVIVVCVAADVPGTVHLTATLDGANAEAERSPEVQVLDAVREIL